MRDPRAPSVQPLPPRSLPHPHSSLWALAPSSCPAQRAQSPEGQREWGLPPQPGTQSPWGRGLPGATATPEDSGPHGPRPAPPSHRAPSCPQASHLAPQAKAGPGGPKPPFLRGGHPASTGTGRGCVHSPEPPSTSAHCPVPSSQGPRLPPAPRACQWPCCPPPAWSTPACALPVSLLPCSQPATVTG